MNELELTDEEVQIILASLRTQMLIVDNMEFHHDDNLEKDLYSNLEVVEDGLKTMTGVTTSDMFALIGGV